MKQTQLSFRPVWGINSCEWLMCRAATASAEMPRSAVNQRRAATIAFEAVAFAAVAFVEILVASALAAIATLNESVAADWPAGWLSAVQSSLPGSEADITMPATPFCELAMRCLPAALSAAECCFERQGKVYELRGSRSAAVPAKSQ
nr:hypothetical protein [uncultured Bacteroides sp.]